MAKTQSSEEEGGPSDFRKRQYFVQFNLLQQLFKTEDKDLQ